MTRRPVPYEGYERCLGDAPAAVGGADMRSLMDTAVEIARSANDRYVRMLSQPDGDLRPVSKPDGSVVTALDTDVSDEVCATLRRAYPGHSVMSEEEDFTGDLSGPLWVVDPVDGTSNLVHGQDGVAFALAFAVDGKVWLAVVAAPLRRTFYWAVRGAGAYRDGRRLTLRDDGRHLGTCLLRTGFPHERSPASAARLAERMARMVMAYRTVQVSGCPVLDICELAEGKVDVQSETMFPWDLAAAGLVAREAGAVIAHDRRPADRRIPVELDGEDVVVGLPRLVEEMQAVLAGAASVTAC